LADRILLPLNLTAAVFFYPEFCDKSKYGRALRSISRHACCKTRPCHALHPPVVANGNSPAKKSQKIDF